MDAVLNRVTAQAVSLAIRSGITITTTYAIKQCARFLIQTPDGKARDELRRLQIRLESKVHILSPAIDLIELIAARGNTTLTSAVTLTKQIRYEIQCLGNRLCQAASESEMCDRGRGTAHSHGERTVLTIIEDIKALLVRIEDAVPMINLAITTSGVNLSTKLSSTISPSRLLQASTFLTAADVTYTSAPGRRQQVGPTYTLSVYMLFAGHSSRILDHPGVRESTWKEVIHKAVVKLIRVPLDQVHSLPGERIASIDSIEVIPGATKADEFAYQLLLIEDLDDDRVHTLDNGERPGQFENVAKAGIRDLIPIHEISRAFYADTGKILNLGSDCDACSPVLLLRRDVHAEPPRRMFQEPRLTHFRPDMHESEAAPHILDAYASIEQHSTQSRQDSIQNPPFHRLGSPCSDTASWRLPADVDPEWIAFEVYTEDDASDNDPETDLSSQAEESTQSNLARVFSGMGFNEEMSAKTSQSVEKNVREFDQPTSLPQQAGVPAIKTTLSLLEMLIKLTALQQFRQESHLAVEDEFLNFFLEDSATMGTGPDKERRQRVRHDTIRRVGFDPYDESPVKRRGEQYIAQASAFVETDEQTDSHG